MKYIVFGVIYNCFIIVFMLHCIFYVLLPCFLIFSNIVWLILSYNKIMLFFYLMYIHRLGSWINMLKEHFNIDLFLYFAFCFTYILLWKTNILAFFQDTICIDLIAKECQETNGCILCRTVTQVKPEVSFANIVLCHSKYDKIDTIILKRKKEENYHQFAFVRNIFFTLYFSHLLKVHQHSVHVNIYKNCILGFPKFLS